MNINKDRVLEVVRHPTTQKVAIGVGSFGAGVLVGYILAHRSSGPNSPKGREDLDEMRKDFEEARARRIARETAVVEEESYLKIAAQEEADEGYSEERETQVGDTVELEDGEEGTVVGFIEPQPQEEEPEEIRRNVFAAAATEGDDWDYEAELKTRDSSEPYVIHKDEFYGEELGFAQHTFTYYNGDDILADEDDKPVYNHAQVVGELKFGHGSGDANVFYVRNEKRKEEYEIVRSDSLFSVDVLGLEIEQNDRARGMEHSSVPRRFRAE